MFEFVSYTFRETLSNWLSSSKKKYSPSKQLCTAASGSHKNGNWLSIELQLVRVDKWRLLRTLLVYTANACPQLTLESMLSMARHLLY